MGRRPAFAVAGIVAVFSLPLAMAQAGEQAIHVPIFSSSDGSRGWVEISKSGSRETAVPMIEVSGNTARQARTAGEAGKEMFDPLARKEEREGGERPDVGEFLKRHKSLVIEESPEGVSLGNALDLLGEIQEAISGNRDADPDRRDPGSDAARSRETVRSDLPGKTALSPADGIPSGPESR